MGIAFEVTRWLNSEWYTKKYYKVVIVALVVIIVVAVLSR